MSIFLEWITAVCLKPFSNSFATLIPSKASLTFTIGRIGINNSSTANGWSLEVSTIITLISSPTSIPICFRRYLASFPTYFLSGELFFKTIDNNFSISSLSFKRYAPFFCISKIK